MTNEQFKLWRSFALRMAHRGFYRIPRKSKKKIAEMVKEYFRQLDSDDIAAIESWDGEVSDQISEMNQHWNPYYWHTNRRGEDEQTNYNKWNDRWFNRVCCCLRAGLDLIVEPSMGVIGFNVCDLRRMYRGNIPAWINQEWEDQERKPVDLNVGDCKIGIWL